MPKPLRLLAPLAILALFAAVLLFRRQRDASDASVPVTLRSFASGESVAVSTAPKDIFRRAFWRHPSPTDVILHAERREWSETGSVDRWQWFIALHPSPALLQALRDPGTFDLRPADAEKDGPAPAAPAWFPATSAGFEILRAGAFTVFYRPGDNLLFATDRGRGFSPPARP